MNQVLMQAAAFIFESDEDTDAEMLLFPSSSSDDENDLSPIKRRGKLVLKPRIKYYVERVVSRYSAEQFKTHFRMYPETFEYILQQIGPSISTTKTDSGRKPIDAKKQLLIAIWTMATPDSLRSICEKFDVGKATALRSLRRVTYALHCIATQFIKWPKQEHAYEVMEQFERYSAFPNTIGAIDGTHIKIKAPSDDGPSYINRKNYHSIQVQAG